jgi:hypothetical protein
MALDTEGFGGEGFRRNEAGGTNGVGGKSGQAGIANAAVVRKRKRKNTRGGSCDDLVGRRKSSSRGRMERLPARLNRIYQVAKQSCREDAPP